MMVFLAGLATVSALVSCDVLRVLHPDRALPRIAVVGAAGTLALVGIAVIIQFAHLAQLA